MYVCDCKKDDCADCAPRKEVDAFEPAHTDRRSTAVTCFKCESPVPKEGTNPSVPRPVAVVSPVPKPAVRGERTRVRGH